MPDCSNISHMQKKSHAFTNLRMSFSAVGIALEPATLPRRLDRRHGATGNSQSERSEIVVRTTMRLAAKRSNATPLSDGTSATRRAATCSSVLPCLSSIHLAATFGTFSARAGYYRCPGGTALFGTAPRMACVQVSVSRGELVGTSTGTS
jgi:hypothetical protein